MLQAPAQAPKLCVDPLCISCTPPEHDPETVAPTDHWKVVLHPSQGSSGTVLLVIRRHVPRMADLSEAEALDFHAVL